MHVLDDLFQGNRFLDVRLDKFFRARHRLRFHFRTGDRLAAGQFGQVMDENLQQLQRRLKPFRG